MWAVTFTQIFLDGCAMSTQDLSLMPCSKLQGVGSKLAEKLAKCGIHTLQDILFHLPLRYQDRTRIMPMAACRVGMSVLVEGKVVTCTFSKVKKAQLQCVLADATGHLQLRFFHFTVAQKNQFREGARVRCFGEVRYARSGLELVHPEYQCIDGDKSVVLEDTLHPIYPATEGLSQSMIYKLTTRALQFLREAYLLPELLPQAVLEKFQLPVLKSALSYLHRPPVDVPLAALEKAVHPYQQRLIFEELLAHQLCMLRLKQATRTQCAPSMENNGELVARFLQRLSFSLTMAQQRVIAEIIKDIAKPYPMRRLVQGDVGSGKTVVAAISLLQSVASGYQGVLMVPTEILAEQHMATLTDWFAPLSLQVVCLTGSTKGRARKTILNAIAEGKAEIIVGTHAVFQETVQFSKLGLVVIDEQHRFGVHQRLALQEKGNNETILPHQLIMTATPIPRTLAMSFYADLDLSVIDELPKGRLPIKTILVSNQRRAEVMQKIRTVCEQGAQVYWVCTLIEDSEVLTSEAAEATAALLSQQLTGISVGLVHGKMKSLEKEAIMTAFKAGDIQLLVATTVIEVGVDVPNASFMIIDNAERLGLAQLHQLRGRVGRGNAESHCVLLYQAPLSSLAQARLALMRETNDGFKIAQKDLEIRGPGELLGTKQTGISTFKVADVIRDQAWLVKAQNAAEELMREYPGHVDALITRWVGCKAQYANV